jgi:copper transport protein
MLAAGVLYLLVIAQVSHGASIPGSFWATAADFAHLLGAAVWVGMLVQLGLFLVWVRRRTSAEEKDVLLLGHLRRFSPFAATSVVVLLATGSANALGQLPDVKSIIDTVYGQVLLVKLGLIATLLLVAGVNAFYLRPRLTSGLEARDVQEGTVKKSNLLWRTVQIEIGLAVLVLLVTAALVQYPTSRQQRSAEQNVETANEAAGFNAVQTAGDVDVQLGISPNQVGTNSYLVYVFPPSTGEPAEVLRVRLRFESPDTDLGPADIIADPTERNSYKAIGPFFNAPGGWTVSVQVRRAEVDDVTAVFDVKVTGIGAAEQGDDFAFPLQAGSWGVVAGALVILLGVVALVWVTQWPTRQPGRASASRGKQPL